MEKLIVFIKNPVLGQVKTRLAATVGNDRALQVYQYLLAYTLNVSKELSVTKAVYYSDFVPVNDEWSNTGFIGKLQTGEDLGMKMLNAFSSAFKEGYRSVVIIGGDCAQLTRAILEQAFKSLGESDVVIGPATDGGYYLLGMKEVHQELFVNKKWSTETVLADTIMDVKKKQLKYHLLPELSDVDDETDLKTITDDLYHNSDL